MPHNHAAQLPIEADAEAGAGAGARAGVEAEAAAVATEHAAPVARAERIRSLDVLRGVAVLGILVMNVQSFALPEAAYALPRVYGDVTGINGWLTALAELFARLKFMAIFSMLFGAGVLLMTDRAEAKEHHAPFGLHARRMALLLMFGLIHAYAFWHGDILTYYAICGLVVYAFRRQTAVVQLVLGLVLIAVTSLISLGLGFLLIDLPGVVNEADLLREANNVRGQLFPDPSLLQDEIDLYRGAWFPLFVHRAELSFYLQTLGLIFWVFWRVTGLMLIGMALYRWGVLSNQRSTRFYLLMLVLGFGIGLPLAWLSLDVEAISGAAAATAAAGVSTPEAAPGFDPLAAKFYGSQWNYWGSLFVAGGWIAVVMLACRAARSVAAGSGPPLRMMLRRVVFGGFGSVGQMAFTNYLMQTVICTFLFYGWGLGWFAALERWQLALVVLSIWLLQLILSPIWLTHFRYGPAEWLWRTLTYLQPQPFRRAPAARGLTATNTGLTTNSTSSPGEKIQG